MNNNYIKRNNYRQQGFSIVELMIAIVIGTIILTGLVTIFDTTSSMNRTQNGLARLQENGRFITVQMKTALDQAGYQYCLSSTGSEERQNGLGDPLTEQFGNLPSIIQPWRVLDSGQVFAGVPGGQFFDPRYFIYGHECDGSGCQPNVGSPGTDLSVTIPSVGTGDGQRLEGTDILTVRYVHDEGVAVRLIDPKLPGTNEQTLYYEDYELTDPSVQFPTTNARVLIASCSDSENHVVTTVNGGGSGTAIINSPTEEVRNGRLTRIFDLDSDFRSTTYYVANNVVNGRDIPTLYSIDNGTVNALVEGVDRFDVLYTVQTNLQGRYQVLDAAGVSALPVDQCTIATDDLPNTPGCGWRSVVSIEFHLLLNTVVDSSTNGDESFFYSVDGDAAQTAADLPSSINHYRMHRREFYSVVATKNWN